MLLEAVYKQIGYIGTNCYWQLMVGDWKWLQQLRAEVYLASQQNKPQIGLQLHDIPEDKQCDEATGGY